MGTIKISWVNNDSNYKNLDNCSSVRSYLWVLWIMGVREEKKILKKNPNPRGRTSLCLDFQRESLPTISLSFLWDNTLKTLTVFLCSKMPRETKAKNPIPEPEHPRRSKARGVSELLTGFQQLFLLHTLSSWSSPEPSLIFPPSLTPSSLPVTSKAQHFEWLLETNYKQFLIYLNYSSPWILIST